MSEQQEAFERDMRRAYKDHEHWEEILAPWVGVQRVIEVNGMEVIETLEMTTVTEAIIERSFFLPRLPKSIVVDLPKEKP
jgi:hypothetical protein